jgi:hypothetical protein
MKKLIIKIIRFFGWLLFLSGSLLAVILFFGLFDKNTVNNRISFIVVIVIFSLLALLGFKLLRYKKNQEKNIIFYEQMPQTISTQSKSDRQATLEKLLAKHEKLYYSGEPEITDSEFDTLWDELKSIAPDSQIIKRIENTKLPKKSPPKGEIYRLKYKDAEGTLSDRNIIIKKLIVGDNPSNTYIYAYCQSVMDFRQFRFDRIKALYDNRKKIIDPYSLIEKYQNLVNADIDADDFEDEETN